MKDLTVFILTHNRGEMLFETIDSVLNQTCHDFKLIVSDNSSNDETARLLQERNLLGKFEYRKRDKEYSSIDHFNMCLSEVDTGYFVLFHDDDIMLPEYVETMYNTINGSEYVAVGCNGYYLYDGKYSKKRMLKSPKDLLITTGKELAENYCKGNIVPYPSYIYSKVLINKLVFCNKLGKYSDVWWLLRILKLSSIRWLGVSLMYYRIHNNQDSAHIDYVNQIKLINCFKAENINLKVLMQYRYSILYMKLREILKKNPKISTYKKKELILLKKNQFCSYVKIKLRLMLLKF